MLYELSSKLYFVCRDPKVLQDVKYVGLNFGEMCTRSCRTFPFDEMIVVLMKLIHEYFQCY